jgi:alanine racemase
VGYGPARAPEGGELLVLRCGYGDGLVRATGTRAGIVTVGMQYTTVWRERPSLAPSVALLDADTDLDDLARAAGVTPHELVVRLGNAVRND